MTRHVPPLPVKLDDELAERVRDSHARAILALQGAASSIPTVLPGITLADGVDTVIAHKLGRRPQVAWPSFVRGGVTAGSINEIRDGRDPTKVIVLRADGWGASITIDVMVF